MKSPHEDKNVAPAWTLPPGSRSTQSVAGVGGLGNAQNQLGRLSLAVIFQSPEKSNVEVETHGRGSQ